VIVLAIALASAIGATAYHASVRLRQIDARANGLSIELEASDAEAAALAQGLQAARDDTAALAKQLADARLQAAKDKANSEKRLAELSKTVGKQVEVLGEKLTAQQEQIAQVKEDAPPNWKGVAGKVVPSVVQVVCGDKTGSGFAVDVPAPDGYATAILTNAHVVDQCKVGTSDQVSYRHSGLEANAYLADAIYDDNAGLDFALLYVPVDIPTLAVAARVEQGDEVATMGFPLGLPSNFTTGVVSHVYNSGHVRTSAAISSGNSGGPLLDKKGRVVGITTASRIGLPGEVAQNLNLAQPIEAACALLDGDSCPLRPR
jgi:S1-C subfamily serine protease